MDRRSCQVFLTSRYPTLSSFHAQPGTIFRSEADAGGQGYVLHRCRGSHYQFVKPEVGTFTVPVHHNLVKVIYVKKIEKL